jgi:hypothetical protein
LRSARTKPERFESAHDEFRGILDDVRDHMVV